ncbi:MAG: STAS domain-containing protein [Ilumatobacteraceae bacterium]
MEPHISYSTDGTTPVLFVTGDIHLGTIPSFAQTLFRTIDDYPTQRIALDLDGVGILDDMGLGIILGAAGRARAHGGELVVIASGSTLMHRFAITGLDRAVKCVSSLHETH